MAEGALLNIADDILKKLGSHAFKEITSAWGSKGQLEKLEKTISSLKNVLLDAQESSDHSRVLQGSLERLKAAVYEADDLFDKVATMASRKEATGSSKLFEEVKAFFSPSNQIALAFSISGEVKKIREVLDDIEKDSRPYGLVQRSSEQPWVAHKQKTESQSSVNAQEIIGRDADKEAILGMLDKYHDQPLSVVSIVGFGGLGKTTLAQLVYNDHKVDKLFDLKLWVCVSDNFDVKEIVRSVLMSATNTEPQNLGLDQLQKQMQEKIIGKKYLLVLDDVWNQDSEKWLKLRDLLTIGREGSKILMTTRSLEVAAIMGSISSHYELKGLQEDDSWSLFKMIAFRNGMESENPRLLNLGKEIVQKCGHVPLAIRVLGSLLCGMDESRWLSIKRKSFAHISEGESNIINILKLSYDHLWPSLKSCFAYCSLFPKDYNFDKENLISLWMAQGFIFPMSENQSLEEVGEEYFLALLNRCFFQEVRQDEWGNARSCKMHDLIHDLAIEVAGIECKMAKQEDTNFAKGVHHVSFGHRLTSSWKVPRELLKLPLLRTILLPEQIRDGSTFSESLCNQLLSSCRRLRVLDMHGLGVHFLPSSIGKLIHLRYLNLSDTPIKALPNSITRLKNLQTLDLSQCDQLKSLPVDIFKKLTALRSLDLDLKTSIPLIQTSYYGELFPLPSGIGKLTSLHKLTYFRISNKSWGNKSTATLSELKNLNNLRGKLMIQFESPLEDSNHEAKEASLSNKHGLEELNILFQWDMDSDDSKALMEGLKPHHNLKKLEIWSYNGETLPSWSLMDNLCISLPNLVEIKLNYFEKCQQMPRFSQLPLLKSLEIIGFPDVEYMESGNAMYEVYTTQQGPLFFPSLQSLKLGRMIQLKGWWKEMEEGVSDDQKDVLVQPPELRYLSKLVIWNCPNLKSMPVCPNLEDLDVREVNKSLSILKMTAMSTTNVDAATTSFGGYSSNLKSLCVSNADELNSLPKECLHHLSSLKIWNDNELESIGLGDILKNLSSLRTLEICYCNRLRCVPRGLQHLTSLETLKIWGCEELDLWENKEMEEGMPWKALTNLQLLDLRWIRKLEAFPNALQYLHNLRSLVISNMNSIKELPVWIGCFTSLEEICLFSCRQLTSLPEGFRQLTSLKILDINRCPSLIKRCRGSTGEDWPKIKHIPLIILEDSW